MSASRSSLVRLLLAPALLAVPDAVHARNAPEIRLRQATEPDSPAWKKPATLSLSIDPNGPDSFSAQVDLALDWILTRPDQRRQTLGTHIVWNRETSGDDRQNNFEAGLVYSIGRSPRIPDESSGQTPSDLARRRVDFTSSFSLDYARTAQYPDLSSATCVATPAAAQCQTQFKESIRASGSIVPLNSYLARNVRALGISYAVAPQFGIDYDHLLNSPINLDTGLEETGGYLSARAQLGLRIVPAFNNARFELGASVQLRQRLLASDSRRPSIERSAVLFEASATYNFVREGNWRAGIGVNYTRGDDPLNGQSGVNRIVLALTLGNP